MKYQAFLFPGQGSQTVGMGQDLVAQFPEAKACFEEADDTLGVALSQLCFEGPAEELTQTRNAQPALLTHSIAVHRILAAAGAPAPTHVAGHSLGEFSAACAVGVFSLADAVRIVRRRGELMWEAGQQVPGTMAAVMGLDAEGIAAVCAEVSGPGVGQVVVANHNSPGQIVISGDVAAVEAVAAPLKEAGARRVRPLPVSGAFHSPLMEVVQRDFADFLSEISFEDPACPVVANVSAEGLRSGDELRSSFVQQLVSPVRWHDSMQTMVDAGCAGFLEVGAGSVLANLGARSFQDAEFISTSDVTGVEKVLAQMELGG